MLYDMLYRYITGFELDLSSIPADINIEYAFYPLFGGILTSLLLLATKAAGLALSQLRALTYADVC